MENSQYTINQEVIQYFKTKNKFRQRLLLVLLVLVIANIGLFQLINTLNFNIQYNENMSKESERMELYRQLSLSSQSMGTRNVMGEMESLKDLRFHSIEFSTNEIIIRYKDATLDGIDSDVELLKTQYSDVQIQLINQDAENRVIEIKVTI